MSKSKKNKNKTDEHISEWQSNPTVHPDRQTEMGVPIPCEQNVENSKEYGENHEM
ncbi:MAG: hypothetical protein IJS03_02230 [Eubacterium sp.]|nr:hypothetical protein [Eubacterium sp.]